MSDFKNLVFEGGGVKGVAYVGALTELKRIKVLSDIRNVAGTSAGSIVALLVALNYSIDEIEKLLSETNFEDFSDDSFGFFLDFFRLLRKFGWNKGRKFYSWVGKIVFDKTGNEDFTFREIHDSEEKGFLELYVVGTNLSKQTYEVYSYETTPDMKIRDALRISMSIPFYFQGVFSKEDVLIDGGVTFNYPISLFDNKKYLAKKSDGKKVKYVKKKDYLFNNETLGFRLDSKDEIEYNKVGWSSVPRKIRNLKDYSFALLSFLMENANRRHLHKNDWGRTIFIDTLGVKTTDFNISKKKIADLIESGKNGVKEYFTWRNSN